jgi:glycosyltransferase involved in cell wall biosynthesis
MTISLDTLRNRFGTVEAWQRRLSRKALPLIRPSWGEPHKRSSNTHPTIAVITVNYNTRHLLARLVYSLKRVVSGNCRLGPIVVVDNKSTDGSVDLIKSLMAAGVVHGILNEKQRYHGPGLNQAMDYLRTKHRDGDPAFAAIDYVFAVDSDVIISKGEIFEESLRSMNEAGAVMSGELEPAQNAYLDGGYLHVSSLLFDPFRVWTRGFVPFEEHGVPALAFQQSIVNRGLRRLHFPYLSEYFAIHLWSGTMKAICAAGERENKYFSWAASNLDAQKPGDAGIGLVLEEFEQVFKSESPNLGADEIARACLRSERVVLRRPYELAPSVAARAVTPSSPRTLTYIASPRTESAGLPRN